MGVLIGGNPYEPDEVPMLRCPICGAELNYNDKVFCKYGHGVIGCQYCIDTYDAEDVL